MSTLSRLHEVIGRSLRDTARLRFQRKYGFVIVYLCEVVKAQCNVLLFKRVFMGDSCCQQYQQDV